MKHHKLLSSICIILTLFASLLDESEKDSIVVIHEDGEISMWDWVRENWNWVSSCFGKLSLPNGVFASSSPRKILHVLMPSSRRFYWIERIIETEEAMKGLRDDPKSQSFALLSCEFMQHLTIPSSRILAAWPFEVQGLWPAAQNGFWLHFKKSKRRPELQLAFFSPILGKLTHWKAPKNLLHFTHHPMTQELVTLDSEGLISVLLPKSGSALVHQPLSRLSLSNFTSITSIYLHQHILMTTTLEGWEMFDSRSGISITSFKWPSFALKSAKLWSWLSLRDTSPGFWCNEGIWRMKSMPISQYTNQLASTQRPSITNSSEMINTSTSYSNHSSITPQMSAAMISRDWALPRLESKYLLDILISYTAIEFPTMNDTTNFVLACDHLVPHLQSPIVLISILEEAHMSSYACNITRQFIDTCFARHISGMSVVSQNEVDLRAFQLFTTFNTDTIHLLRKFVDLGSDNVSIPILSLEKQTEGENDEDTQIRKELMELPATQCDSIDLSHFYIYMNRCPEVLMTKLLEYSGFSIVDLNSSSAHIWPCTEEIYSQIAFLPPINLTFPSTIGPTLLREEERATHPDIFVALCLLIYRFHPQWLLPFVDTLIHREAFNEGRSMLPRRALTAIPTFELRYAYEPTTTTTHNDDGKNDTNGSLEKIESSKRKEEKDMEDMRLLARIGLLERAHRSASALYTLLQLYQVTHNEKYWKMILFSIDSKSGEKRGGIKNSLQPETSTSKMSPHQNLPSTAYIQKTRTELLTTLLMFCLDPANRIASPRHFEDIFSRMSKNLTAMDLTTSLRQEYARTQSRKNTSVLVTDEASQMSVSTLRSQLLKLGVK
jgi:hypothetical protein